MAKNKNECAYSETSPARSETSAPLHIRRLWQFRIIINQFISAVLKTSWRGGTHKIIKLYIHSLGDLSRAKLATRTYRKETLAYIRWHVEGPPRITERIVDATQKHLQMRAQCFGLEIKFLLSPSEMNIIMKIWSRKYFFDIRKIKRKLLNRIVFDFFSDWCGNVLWMVALLPCYTGWSSFSALCCLALQLLRMPAGILQIKPNTKIDSSLCCANFFSSDRKLKNRCSTIRLWKLNFRIISTILGDESIGGRDWTQD